MSDKLVFVTGAYGVGKSTVCQQIPSSIGFKYLKASTLIFDYLQTSPPTDKRIADSDDLYTNQYALIHELSRQRTSEHILLEGHTCLLDRNMRILQIPLEILGKFNMSAIVLITHPISEIHHTLIHRDHVDYNATLLSQLQEQEHISFSYIAKVFDIPSLHIDFSNQTEKLAVENLKHFLDTIFTNRH